jgi:hypothetical protein
MALRQSEHNLIKQDEVLSLSNRRLSEIDSGGITATNDHADALAGAGLIAFREQSGKGSGTSGFGDNTQNIPESLLRALDGLIGDQEHAIQVLLCDGEHQFAHAFGRERIGGDAAGFSVDRLARL